MLLSRSADVNTVDDGGLSALHQAALHGAEQCIVALLDASCDPDIRGTEGWSASALGVTPLMRTCWYGHEASARLLLDATADINKVDANGFGCFHHGAVVGTCPNRAITLLAEKGASADGLGLQSEAPNLTHFNTVYSRSLRTQTVAVAVAFFSMRNGPIGVLTDVFRELIAMRRSTPLCEAVKNGNTDFSDMIIRSFGASVGAADALGNTAIFFAARSANECMVEMLQRHGADLCGRNTAGEHWPDAMHRAPVLDLNAFRLLATFLCMHFRASSVCGMVAGESAKGGITNRSAL